MITNFPEGYKTPESIKAMWPELERKMLPIIKAKAKRVRHFAACHLDMDDAIQEGRLALLSALIDYDYNRGELDHYIGVVLNNTYRGMIYEMLTQSRMPRVSVRSDEGGWETKTVPPLSLSAATDPAEGGMSRNTHERVMYDHDMPTPELVEQHRELKVQAGMFKLKLLNKLKGRDRLVFECKTNPSVDFLKMIQNTGGDIYDPTVPDIARYLGVSKNTVDWSMFKIKQHFTRMARGKEFIELFGEVVESKEWPMIHMSKAAKHDTEFVSAIIKRRGLDPKPVEGYERLPDFHQKNGMFSRMIERYPWGVVLVLKRKGVWRTLVIECSKFNPLGGTGGGDIFGESGAHETVPVKWYPALVKALKAKAS